MAVTVLNTATGVQGSTNNPMTPSAGAGERYWIIAIMREGGWTTIPSAITVTGTTDSNFTQIGSISGPTFRCAFYGAKEADIGTSPNTGNGSITYDDGTAIPGSSTVIGSIVCDGVDQTTPFTNTEDDGYSVDSTNNTQNCPFTLDEIEDALGVAFVSCSKTGTTWTLTDNGYAKNGDGQWVQSTNTSANCATKSITAQSLNVTTTLTSGLTGDKTGTLAVMLLPSAGGPDTTPDVFDYTDQTDLALSTVTTSDLATITGIEAAADISVVGGEFSIDGGAYTSTATTISNNQTLRLRQTSSVFGGATTTVTVTVDTIDVDWKITTATIAELDELIEDHETSGSVLTFGHGATNTSSATYKEDTGEVAVVRNGTGLLYLYDLDDYTNVNQTLTLNFDGSDVEGIADMGNGEFCSCSEDGGRYQFNIYDWPASDAGDVTVNSKQEFTLAANGTDNNSGPEGICYDRANTTFYICGEGEQASTDRRFFKVLRPGVAGRFGDTSSAYAYNDADDGDGWSLDDYISEPFDPETAFSSLGAEGAQFDLSDLDFDNATGNVLISSHTGAAVIQINPANGTVISELDISGDGFTQVELVAILPDGKVIIGGEASEYKIYTAITTSQTLKTLVVGTTKSLTLGIEVSYGRTISFTTNKSTSLDNGLLFNVISSMTTAKSLTLDALSVIGKLFSYTATKSSSIQKEISKVLSSTTSKGSTQQKAIDKTLTVSTSKTSVLQAGLSFSMTIPFTTSKSLVTTPVYQAGGGIIPIDSQTSFMIDYDTGGNLVSIPTYLGEGDLYYSYQGKYYRADFTNL